MEQARHVAIIMDGNGRWARKQGKSRRQGHREGVKALERIARAAANSEQIQYLTVFAFSTENWKRPGWEVKFLFDLLRSTIRNELDKLQEEEQIMIKVIGRLQELDPDIQEDIKRIEKISRNNRELVLTVAVNYGARAEILDAVNSIIRTNLQQNQNSQQYKNLPQSQNSQQNQNNQMYKNNQQNKNKPQNKNLHQNKNNYQNKDNQQIISQERENKLISETELKNHLYNPGLPEVDLLIRTGGEKRISNFLLWQISYAELFFTPILWPDFTAENLEEALDDFARRQRKYGGLPGEER